MDDNDKLLVINQAALQETITLAETIEIVDLAMRELSAGLVAAPERTVMAVNAATRLGLMPGAMPSLARFGVKVVSLSADAAPIWPSQPSGADAAVRQRHGAAAGGAGLPRPDADAHSGRQRGGDPGAGATRCQDAGDHRPGRSGRSRIWTRFPPSAPSNRSAYGGAPKPRRRPSPAARRQCARDRQRRTGRQGRRHHLHPYFFTGAASGRRMAGARPASQSGGIEPAFVPRGGR